MGNSITTKDSPDDVLLYESIDNHMFPQGLTRHLDPLGIDVLYADGHVDHLGEQHSRQLIRELQAGENPPP